MSLNTNYPSANPRLGTSFAIFTSTFVCLVLMLIILERLGLERSWINQLIILLPVLFYLAIGVLARTVSVDDFFVSGQRVPALYNGLALSANVMGGVALLGAVGGLFFVGFDALPLLIGWCAGLGLMAILLAPYLRKAGAYTLPGFFGIRFGSRSVRLVAALLLIPPALMLLAGELKVGAMIATFFLPLPPDLLLRAGLGVIVLTVILGGVRSLTWTQCAQFIVVLLGIAVPLIIVSILVTNLPLPQLTYGDPLEELSRLEPLRGIAGSAPQALSQALPPATPQALEKPFAVLFGSISGADFVLLTLCVALGTAVLPTQMTRLSTTPTVSAVRQSLCWAVLLIGFMALTLPAYAVFTKYLVVKDLLGVAIADLPNWGRVLNQLGLATISGNGLDPALGSADVRFTRDTVALALPVMGGFPLVLLGVVAAAVIAAVLGAAAGHMLAMANAFSNDVYYPLLHRTASPARRLLIARLAMIAAALAALWLAERNDFDPLRLMLWAVSLCAASFFPVLVLAIWWRGLTTAGALFGMAGGFAVTAGYIALTADGGPLWFGVDTLAAAAIGVPLSLGVAVAVSMITPRPDERIAELVGEMRMPSGETLHTRLMRLAARGKAPRP